MSIIDNTLAAQVPQYDAVTPLRQVAQLQAQQQELQQAQFKQKQTEVGAEMRGVAPFVNSPEFPAKWSEATDRLLQRGVIDPQTHERIRNSPSPLMLKSIISQTDTPEMAQRKDEAVRAQGNSDRSYGLLKQAQDRADRTANEGPLEQAGQRESVLKKYGIDPASQEGKSYIITGNLPVSSKLPTSAEEYEYYKKNFQPTDEQQKPMDYATFSTAKARAAATNVTTTVDTKAETEQSKKVGGALGEAQADDIKAGGHAGAKLRQLATLDNANQVGGDDVSSGPLGKAILTGKQGLSEVFGIDLKGVPESEVIQKVGFGLATSLTKAISNRPAQMEFMKALENVPGLFMSKQGRVAMTSILTQEAKAEQEIGKLAARHKDKPNSPVWQEIKDRYYDEHPLISPFTNKPFTPEDIQMVVKSSPGATAPQTGGPTRAEIEAEIRKRQAAQQ